MCLTVFLIKKNALELDRAKKQIDNTAVVLGNKRGLDTKGEPLQHFWGLLVAAAIVIINIYLLPQE